MFRSGGMRSVSKQIAHTTILPLGNKDLRLLQDLISAEKNVVGSLTKLADDLAKASEALKQWGLGEGEDLGDILSASREILICVSSALAQFGGHEASIRVHMKAVRTREENLDATKKARKAVGSKAEAAEKKLSKMSSEHKQLAMQTDLLNRLRDEMRQLDSDILVEEARISDYKRQTTKDWMALKFGGLLELAQKVVHVGNFGKEIIEEIPLDITMPGYGRAPYTGHERAGCLLADATHAIGQVVFQPITGNLAYHYEPGSQMAPPPLQTTPSHLETPAQSIARQQGGYSGLGHGLPPQPEPHAAYPGMSQGPPPQLDRPDFDRSFAMMISSTNPDGASEFGQFSALPVTQQSQTLGVGGVGGGPYPPRTSSVRTDDNNNRFATFPNHDRPSPPNVGATAPTPGSSVIYSSTPNPAFNQQRPEYESATPPLPAVPPKNDNSWTQPNQAVPPAAVATERQRPASGSSSAPPLEAHVGVLPRAANDQSRFSMDSVQDLELDFGQNDADVGDRRHSPSTSRPPARKSYSGISDGGEDMVLAYYHDEGDEGNTPVAETTPIPSVGMAGPVAERGNTMGRPGESTRGGVEEGDPYATDAFENGTHSATSSYAGPHQPPLDLPPTEPLRPRSVKGTDEIHAANVAAAREVGRELDALNFSSAVPPSTTMAGPPPRLSSKSALRPQKPLGLSSPPYSSPSVPQEASQSTPPHLSLRFTDTSFNLPGISSPTSPEVNNRLHSLNPGTSPDVPRSVRARSPPPSFEVATSASQTPPTFSSTRPLPTAVFDPNVIPATTQSQSTPPPPPSSTSNSLSVAGPTSVSRSSSVESALSSLAPPHLPYAASSPSRGTLELMPLPATPGGSPSFDPESPSSPKTISAGAFKRFRGGDSPGRPGASDVFPGRKQSIPPMDSRPSYTSAASGNSDYTSAPSSPARERSSSEVYRPSPLSVPIGSRKLGGDHDGSGSYRDMMLSPGGNHLPIGVAMGSPTNSNVPEGWTSSGRNRLTIGDAGWQSRSGRNGSLPGGSGVDEGGDNHNPGRTGGYGTGNYTTSLE
ncbi:hypothetical protein FRB96_006562 [Tulasnella sp. 330]|nr:hypothetical protein FRB96_006562 [Tulasnella sp. 330]